jgi:MFS transporter, BCD family, chlorophyll transporter
MPGGAAVIVPRNLLKQVSPRWLPFADAASDQLPMSQILRLSLFQLSVGMATVLLLGTLNRVMIVELSLAASLVAAMIALPVLVAPFRALLGFKSDHHRSAIGWKRVPYLWFGSLWQFGGLAVMPFALLVLGGDVTYTVPFAGEVLAALAFIMTGFGLHMTQTAGVALAADRATDETRPRVVALLYVTFLLGMAISAVIVGLLLADYSDLRLIQVVQGCAAATMIINVIALWRQEKVRPMTRAEREAPKPKFSEAWADFVAGGQVGRLLAVVAVGGLAFNMQDVLLEPYGGEVLGLSVAATTLLTAFHATGALTGFLLSARTLGQGADPFRLAAKGILIGVAAFSAVICAAPMGLPSLFYLGAFGIGLGMGLFAVSTLTAAMALPTRGLAGGGLALGAWGAAQATAAGLAVALGGGIRDSVDGLAQIGALGALTGPDVGYMVVYHLEIGLLFATLALLGPLVRMTVLKPDTNHRQGPIGLAEFPT